jgi:repressor LexA
MVKQPLTRRQRDVLLAIVDLTEEHGYPPTVREIGKAVGLCSTSTVWHHIETLRRLGYVTGFGNSPRTLRVVDGPNP